MVNNNPPKVILTDEDKAISQAIQNVFGQNSKHVLCIWHLWKNVIKNLCSILGANWHNFTKAFYECTKEYEVDNFIIKWQQLQIDFPDCKAHLERMDKVKEKWAPCFNRDIFLADKTSTQCEESMNNLMKSYMQTTHSLLDFLKAFESALDNGQFGSVSVYIKLQFLTKTEPTANLTNKTESKPNSYNNTKFVISQQYEKLCDYHKNQNFENKNLLVV